MPAADRDRRPRLHPTPPPCPPAAARPASPAPATDARLDGFFAPTGTGRLDARARRRCRARPTCPRSRRRRPRDRRPRRRRPPHRRPAARVPARQPDARRRPRPARARLASRAPATPRSPPGPFPRAAVLALIATLTRRQRWLTTTPAASSPGSAARLVWLSLVVLFDRPRRRRLLRLAAQPRHAPRPSPTRSPSSNTARPAATATSASPTPCGRRCRPSSAT